LEPGVAIIQTTITATREEVDLLPGVLVQATGNLGLQPAAELATEIVAGELPGAPLKVAMLVNNAPPGRVFVGDLNFTLGNLEVTTVAGQTVVLITLDQAAGLSITGSAMLIGTAGGGIDLNIENPKLVLLLSAQDVSDLPGGSATVTQIGGNLVLDIINLPDGASLAVTFAKDPSVFIDDAAAKFSLLAENINRETGNLADDLAFVVNVKKTGITNDDLGDTQITLEVSQQWFDERRALDLSILFAKFDDNGNPVLPALDVTDSCASTGNGTVVCKGNFTGAQGGLSTFGEFAGGTGTGY